MKVGFFFCLFFFSPKEGLRCTAQAFSKSGLRCGCVKAICGSCYPPCLHFDWK